MLRRQIKSALYIDFENVPLPPESISSWLAWLEDGAFEASGRRRRFLEKRVYWNSHAERNRELFQRHGFAAILVGKFAGLKNGADIRMAMDIVEATYMRAEIDEFILLTGDSDFVPVLERLRQKSKRSAIVATEHRPNVHTTYHLNADILIPSRRLGEAAAYRRRTHWLWHRLAMRWQARAAKSGVQQASRPSVSPAKPATSGRDRNSMIAAAGSTIGATAVVDRPEPPPALDAAAQAVARLVMQQPRNYVGQRRIVTELERISGFKRQGPAAFLGMGSYRELMQELARRDARITIVEQPGGGTGVVHLLTAEKPESFAAEATDDAKPTAATPSPPSAKASGSEPVSLTSVAAPSGPASGSPPDQPTAVAGKEPSPLATHSPGLPA